MDKPWNWADQVIHYFQSNHNYHNHLNSDSFLHGILDSNHHMNNDSMNNDNSGSCINVKANSEFAYRMAEGTIRTMRNLVLAEAVDLHSALKFWSSRYEQPFLSCLEAGPYFLFGSGIETDNGTDQTYTYDHSSVGVKVAQIQAVLARRIGVIGELQQHLLRAGWQRGVAQWGE